MATGALARRAAQAIPKPDRRHHLPEVAVHVVPPRAEADGQVLTVPQELPGQLPVSKHVLAEEDVLRTLTLRHAAVGQHGLVALRLPVRVAEDQLVLCGALRGGIRRVVRLAADETPPPGACSRRATGPLWCPAWLSPSGCATGHRRSSCKRRPLHGPNAFPGGGGLPQSVRSYQWAATS